MPARPSVRQRSQAARDPRPMHDFKLADMELLHYLLRQAAIPEYQMCHWRPDTLVIWDNQDDFPAVRRMMRATVVGDRPR